MSKAISITQKEPTSLAIESAVNSAKAVYEFMYGTAERTKLTMYFAFGMLAVAAALDVTSNTVLNYCM